MLRALVKWLIKTDAFKADQKRLLNIVHPLVDCIILSLNLCNEKQGSVYSANLVSLNTLIVFLSELKDIQKDGKKEAIFDSIAQSEALLRLTRKLPKECYFILTRAEYKLAEIC